MNSGFHLGAFELTWLNGGSFALDGGAMFGVVPKVLWSRKYPSHEDNTIPMVARPLLVRTASSCILIETGLGNKLTEKQKKIYKVSRDWDVLEELRGMGIQREDIEFVVLTHYDFDHAGGVVMQERSGISPDFPQRETCPPKKRMGGCTLTQQEIDQHLLARKL